MGPRSAVQAVKGSAGDTLDHLLDPTANGIRRWLDHVSVGLGVPLSDVGLVRSCLRLSILQGGEIAEDLGVHDFDLAVVSTLDALSLEVWVMMLRKSTSPKPILIGLSARILERDRADRQYRYSTFHLACCGPNCHFAHGAPCVAGHQRDIF